MPAAPALVRLAAPALVAAALAGCDNSPHPPSERAERVIYRQQLDDPRSLDPSFAYTVTEARIVDVIYSSYYQYHYLKHEPPTLVPNLGAAPAHREAAWVRDGPGPLRRGERWSFRIRPGLRFSNDPCFPGGRGREVTARDFLYSFRRMADPKVRCPILSFVEDKVAGYQAFADLQRRRAEENLPADLDAPCAGLEADAADPHTFHIVLNQPYPQLRFLMAMHFTAPIPREAVERYGRELARHPVGCGPFKLTEYSRRRRIVLEKNENRPPEPYPAEGGPGDREAGLLRDAGAELPLVDKAVFTTVREATTAWNLFLQGYLDVFAVDNETYSQVMARPGELSPEMEQRGVTLTRTTDPRIDYFAFNMEDPVWGGYGPAQRKLRQAVSLTLDAQSSIDLFSQGNGIPAEFIVPPGVFGYDPGYRNPYRRDDLARAKQLLEEAGYPGGVDPQTGERLTLYYDNAAVTAAGRLHVGWVKKKVEALGIRLESRTFRPAVWEDQIDEGKFQFYSYGWLADYPDPENFVFLLYGPNKRPGPNGAAYRNPEYDRLFEQMRAMDDGPERRALIRRMRDIAVEDCPWVFLKHDWDLVLANGWIGNLKLHPLSNDWLKYVRVDPALRERRRAEWNRPNYWPLPVVGAVLVLGTLPAVAVARRRARRRLRRGGA